MELAEQSVAVVGSGFGGLSVACHLVAAATRRGVVRVSNLSVRDPVGHTGPGDRFGAALALANPAASHYVETGDTGDRTALREFSRTREP